MHMPNSTRDSVWKPLCQKSAIVISNLMVQQQRNWGVDRFPPVVVQPISLALFTVLDDLESTENQSSFINLCYFMQVVSMRYRAGRGILALARRTIAERRIAIPPEANRFLAEETFGRRPSQPSRPSSDGSEIDIDYLLGKWKDFNLNQQTGSR